MEEKEKNALLGEIKEAEQKIAERLNALTALVADVTMSPERLWGLKQVTHNLSNIYLRTGNHEVQTAIKEIARGFCFVIGESHQTFFPNSPINEQPPEPNAATVLPGSPEPGFPIAAQQNGMVAAQAALQPIPLSSGIAVPGMPPSPFALPSQHNAQGAAHPVAGSPAALAPGESRMVVVSDPNGQMGPSGGPPPGTPGFPGPISAPAAIPNPPLTPQMTLDRLAARFQPMAQETPSIDIAAKSGSDPSPS